MPTTYNLTGDLGDLLGGQSVISTARAWLETNLDGSDALVDVGGSEIRLGGSSVSIAADGTFTVTGLVGSDSTDLNVDPGTLQYQLVVEYRDPGTSGNYKRTWRSGWFFLNAASDIATVAKSATPAVAATGAEIISAASAEADRAEAAAELAVAPTDTQVATLAQDPESETGQALSATSGAIAAREAHRARGMSMQAYEQQARQGLRVLWQDGSLLYANQGEANIWKSADNGVTWTQQGGLANVDALFRASTGTLLAASNSSQNLYRSTDDGVTWVFVKALTEKILGGQGIIEAPDGSLLYGDYGNVAATNYSIWRSTDDGETWANVFTPPITPSATQIHSIVYDDVEGCLLAFQDGAPPRIYRSDDNGVTWVLIGEATEREHPNWVAPMFFDNYIAWGYDSEYGGMIARLSREDFYAGAWTGNVEQIAAVNGKAWYWTFPARPGVWIVALVDEVIDASAEGYTNPKEYGSFTQEVYIVSEDGSQVHGGLAWADLDAHVGDLTANKIRFPGYPRDHGDQGGIVWLSMLGGYTFGFSALPTTVGWGDPLPRIDGKGGIAPLYFGNEEPVYAFDSAGVPQQVLRYSSADRLHIQNPKSAAAPEIRMYGSAAGNIAFVFGGAIIGQMLPNEFRFEPGKYFVLNGSGGPRVMGGTGSPEGVLTAPTGSMYLNASGGAGATFWVKESGAGNTGWVAK